MLKVREQNIERALYLYNVYIRDHSYNIRHPELYTMMSTSVWSIVQTTTIVKTPVNIEMMVTCKRSFRSYFIQTVYKRNKKELIHLDAWIPMCWIATI